MNLGHSKFRRRSKRLRRLESTVEQLESRVLLSASAFSISDSQVIEGNSDTEMVFVVTRYNPEADYSQEESVAYFTDPVPNSPFAATTGRFDGTDDYYSQSFVATFAPGANTTEIRVTVVGDTRNEHDEAIVVTLSPRSEFSSREDLTLSNNPRGVYKAIVVEPNRLSAHPLLLVAATDPTPLVSVYENLAPPGATPQLHFMAALPSFTPGTSVVKLAAADFDNDGLQDIVIGDASGIMVYRQSVESFSGVTSFESVYSFATTDLSDFMIGNVTDEGFPDLIVADRATSQVTFLVSEITVTGGAIAFAAPQSLTVADHPGLSRIGLSIIGKYAPTLVTLVTPDNSDSLLGFNNFASSPGSSALVFNFGNQEPLPVVFDGIEYPGNAVPLNESAADLELGNFGADARLDLAVSVHGADGRILKLFEDHTEDYSLRLKFDSIPSPFVVGHNPNLPLQSGTNLELADFNRDGRSDGGIAATLNSFFLFQSTPDVTQSLVPGVGVFEGFTFGDLDFDGSDDVIVFPSGFTEIAWQRNVSQGSGAMALGTIVNDDTPHVRVSLSRDTLVAGDPLRGNGTIHAELVSGLPLDYDLYVNFEFDPASTATFYNGSNAASADIFVSYITVRIPAGELSGDQIISSAADAPGQVEPDETAIFQFYGGGDYVLENVGPQTVTIISSPVIRLAIASDSVTEGQAGQIQLIAFTNKPALVDTDITVNLVAGVSTASTADLLPGSWSSIHIAAGQTYGSLSLAMVDDSIYEGTEYATFELGEILQGIGRFEPNNQVTATLFDNESPPENVDPPQVRLSLSQSTVIAGGNTNQSTAKIRAELAGGQPLANDLTVTLTVDVASTASGAGAANPDYSLTSLNVIIPAGSTFGEITLSALPDGTGPLEPDETVILRATASAAYVLESTAPLTVTIASIPQIRLGLVQNVVTEGDGRQITLVAYATRPMLVDTDVLVALTPNESTAVEADFVGGSAGVIRIPAGQTSGTLAITVADDILYESAEYATFGLAGVAQGLARVNSTEHVIATILDNDPPPVGNATPQVRLSLSQSTVIAGGNANQSTAKIRAELAGGQLLANDLTVTLVVDAASTASGAGATNPDYSLTSLNVVIPAGSTFGVIALSALPDGTGPLEPDETVILRATASAAYVLESTAPLTVTVASVPEIRLGLVRSVVTEGDGNQITLVAYSNRPMVVDTDVAVGMILNESTATASDFVASTSGVIHIAAGQTSGTFSLAVANDSIFESTDFVTFGLVSVAQGLARIVSTEHVIATILDNDPPPVENVTPQVRLSLSRSTVIAGGGENELTRIRAELVGGQPLANDLTVTLVVDAASTASGAGTANPDYSLTSLNVVIPAGSTFGVIALSALPDGTGPLEPDETVILRATASTAYVLESTAPLTVIIASLPEIRLGLLQNVVTEGDGNQITLVAYATRPMLVDTVVLLALIPSESTATEADFVNGGGGIIFIPAGGTSGTYAASITEDAIYEPTELATFGLGFIFQGLARVDRIHHVTATIRDNEPTPVLDLRRVLSDGTLSSSFTTMAESGGSGDLVAVIDTPVSYAISVTLSASGSLSRTEYTTTYNDVSSTSTLPTLIIPAGATRSSVLRIQSVDDTVVEANETLELSTASVPGSYTLGVRGPVAIAVIDNDTPPPSVLPVIDLRRVLSDGSLTTSFTTISETNGISDLVAVLDSPLSYAISVTLTATGSLSRAEYSTTYNSQSSTSQLPTLVIPAGATRSTVLRVQSLDDSVLETDESLELSITPATSTYNIGVRGPISLIVVDNDATLSPLPVVDLRRIAGGGGFLPSTASIAEAAGGAQIVAVIDTPLTRDLTVVVTASGTLSRAEFSSAYNNGASSTTQLQTLTIPAGATRSLAMQISSIDDSVAESDETLTLTAVALPGIYTVGTRGPVTLTITDDDTHSPRVSLQASTANVAENGGISGFYVKLDQPASGPVTVQLQFSGTASSSDYTALQTIVIPAGETTGFAWVKGTDDILRELDETIIATIQSIVGPAEGLGSQATISILDDDAPVAVVLFDESDGFGEQDGTGYINVTLTEVTAYDVTIRFGFTGTATLGVDYTPSFTSVTIPAGQRLVPLILQGIADRFVEGSETVTVSIASIDTAAGGRIVAIPASHPITYSIRDDLRPQLSRTSTTPISTDEDQNSGLRSFRLFDYSGLGGATTLSFISSNPTLIDASGITITNRFATSRDRNQDNRYLSLTPKRDQFGTATITVRASNSLGTGELSFEVVVNPANDPPGFTGGGPLVLEMAAVEDSPNSSNYGVSISSLLRGVGNPTRSNSLQWGDIDPPPNLRGIAVTSANRALGDWEYTTDGGSTWHSLEEVIGFSPRGALPLTFDVADNHALLLAADDGQQVRLRFLPKPNYHGYSTLNQLQFTAWDQTYGTSGTYININALSGAPRTAFGANAAVQVEVFPVNDFPPVLTLGPRRPQLATIPEQLAVNQAIPEFTVRELLDSIVISGGSYFDEDYPVPGVAVRPDPIGNGYGSWEYNTGSGWRTFPTLNSQQYILLAESENARVRFNASGYSSTDGGYYTLEYPDALPTRYAPTLNVKLWDYSTGHSGDKVFDDSGTNALSSMSRETASVQVQILRHNDAPVLSDSPGNYVLVSGLYSDEGTAIIDILKQLYQSRQESHDDPAVSTFDSFMESLDRDNPGNAIGVAVGDGRDFGIMQAQPLGTDEWYSLFDVDYRGIPTDFYALGYGTRIRVKPVNRDITPVSLQFLLHDGGGELNSFFVYHWGTVPVNPYRLLSYGKFYVADAAPQSLRGTEASTSEEGILEPNIAPYSSEVTQWWEQAGLSEPMLSVLQTSTYGVSQRDDDGTLGLAARNSVFVNSRALGIGWFIDPTPFLNEEYELGTDGVLHAIPGGLADGKYDLLSVLAHEQGHLLGLPDLDVGDGPESLMTGLIAPGVRRKPSDVELDALFELLAAPLPRLAVPSESDS